ncbi:MAG: lplA [Chlamydiales bacterium]|jgi:lipoate-protein ligase A|nr:lplA [Chlamydiales bacterium]
MLQVIDSPPQSAQALMDFEARLLQEMPSQPTLHFYDWQRPTITYGYFIDTRPLLREGITAFDLAKRPTGGGVTFHLHDLSFSLLVPKTRPLFALNTLDSYAAINAHILQALHPLLAEKGSLLDESRATCSDKRFFCLGEATRYDVMVGNRKLGGCAQRRTKEGFLHQVCLSLAQPPKEMLKKALPSEEMVEVIFANSYPLFAESEAVRQRPFIKELLKEAFQTFELLS